MLINVIRPVPPQAVEFIKAHEGLRLRAYMDVAGVCTIGYGHTGPDVRPDMVIDKATADQLCDRDLAHAASALEARIGEACVSELTDNQYSALLSFVFNLGTGDPKKKEWAIWGYLRAQNFDAAYRELPLFVNAGGHKNADLTRRRAEEQVLWSTGEPGTVENTMSSAVTRQIDTPPIPAAVKPLHQSKSFIGSCVAAACTIGSAGATTIKSAADQASAAIAPYVGHSAVLRGLSDHLALVAAFAALAVPAMLWLKQHEAKSQ